MLHWEHFISLDMLYGILMRVIIVKLVLEVVKHQGNPFYKILFVIRWMASLWRSYRSLCSLRRS